MDEDLKVLDGWIDKHENPPPKEGEEAQQETEEKPEENPDAPKLKEAPPATSQKDKVLGTLKAPGSIALLLIFILFLVFAVSPVSQDQPYTRLQLLLSVILRGGHMRDKYTSGVQSSASMPSNGTSGGDYFSPGLLFPSGAQAAEIGNFWNGQAVVP